MDSKLVLEILKYIHYALNKGIPYKWDFCRIALEGNLRLCVNIGSYFIGYAAFIFWFTNSVLRELKSLAGERLSYRYRCLALALSLSTSTQVLWPALLMSTYFFACSFYPWLSTIIILLLNTKSSILPLITVGVNKAEKLIQTALAIRKISEVESDSSMFSIDYSAFPGSFEEGLHISPKKAHSDTDVAVKRPKITHSVPFDNSWETTYVSSENEQTLDGSASEIQGVNEEPSHSQENSIEELLIDRNMMIINDSETEW